MAYKIIKKRHGYFVQNKDITSQYLGFGKTKKEAINDYNDTIKNIFSNTKRLWMLKNDKI